MVESLAGGLLQRGIRSISVRWCVCSFWECGGRGAAGEESAAIGEESIRESSPSNRKKRTVNFAFGFTLFFSALIIAWSNWD